MMNKKYNSVLIIGMGLIGSSIARAMYENQMATNVYGVDSSEKVIKKCEELNIVSKVETNIKKFNEQFDLIIICTPLSKYKDIFNDLNLYVSKTTFLTDVGSTKVSVIDDFKKSVKNENLKFLPAHPIAGIEKSGPEFGFSKLFQNRYCIVTPIDNDKEVFETLCVMWKELGMKIEIMDAEKHDKILAMTSHIPQLIAYSVVATATELETHLKDEVIKYSAAGFRDFTRLAGSDPIMWRDIYDKNKDAVIEMLGRFSEDLSSFQKAIRNNDLKYLENKFSSSKNIRKIIEDLGQAGHFDPTEKKN
ncbi:MAG: Prephenate dehydrogenase [Alphaproteobacteria bacterium MarineAlpha5_Bin5]|nr:MAG: Prephenate dehydrogenase [Alphaproteobacteria bacterium MarineAlpha5_Bin5]PPR52818.1 MAG: Prephenate dehydrogenase [Alphaproteobacteria bacterium MarineAlpha5_Bin4]